MNGLVNPVSALGGLRRGRGRPFASVVLLAVVAAALTLSSCLVDKRLYDSTLDGLAQVRRERDGLESRLEQCDELERTQAASLAATAASPPGGPDTASLGICRAERDACATRLELCSSSRDALVNDPSTRDALRAELERSLDSEQIARLSAEADLEASKSSLARVRDTLEQEQAALIEARAQLEEAGLREKASAQRDQEVQVLRERLATVIDAGQVTIAIDRGRLVVTLPQGVLFGSGQATLGPEGVETVKAVATALAELKDRRFQVEGHSDNVPMRSARFPSNWELSAERALAVVRVLVDAGMAPQRVSGAGFAEFQPRASNDTKEGRALNRRIEIVMLPDLEALPGIVEGL